MDPKKSVHVHPTAVVAKEAVLGPGVEIGPYSVIGAGVRIGRDTKIQSHVVIDGNTAIGERCEIFPGACLGQPPQIRNYKSVRSFLTIGNDNLIREFVTIHRAMKEGATTTVGDRNFFMANVHIAHDCVVGNDVTMANGAVLSGHVTVEDKAVLSGYCGAHQFVRIGKLAMIGGLSKAVMDVPPFSIYDGHPARFFGVNAVGLKRAGYTSSRMVEIKKVLKIFFGSGKRLTLSANKIKSRHEDNPDIQYLIEFIEKSNRGIPRSPLKAKNVAR